MDPFVTTQQFEHTGELINGIIRYVTDINGGVNQQIAEQTLRQAHAVPIQEDDNVRNFEFTIPTQSLEQVFALQQYVRPKPHIHYRQENGKNYYNTNVAMLAYQDPEVEGATAMNNFLAANPNAQDGALTREYTRARNAAIIANGQARQQIPVWELCTRTEPNDTRVEDTLLVFLDDTHRQVDWYATVFNIRDAGEAMGYTLEHYNRVMNRFVSYYEPKLLPSLRDLDANNAARFLLSLKVPVPMRQRKYNDILSLVREANTPLRTVMAQLLALATAYYQNEPQAQRPNLINALMIKGLQIFTSGQTNVALNTHIRHNLNVNRQNNYAHLLHAAILSEELHGSPPVRLHFSQPGQTVSIFNTTFDPVDATIVQTYPPVMPPMFQDPRTNMVYRYAEPQYNSTTNNVQPAPFQNYQNIAGFPQQVPPQQHQAPIQPLHVPLQQPLMPIQQQIAPQNVMPPVRNQVIPLLPPQLPPQGSQQRAVPQNLAQYFNAPIIPSPTVPIRPAPQAGASLMDGAVSIDQQVIYNAQNQPGSSSLPGEGYSTPRHGYALRSTTPESGITTGRQLARTPEQGRKNNKSSIPKMKNNHSDTDENTRESRSTTPTQQLAIVANQLQNVATQLQSMQLYNAVVRDKVQYQQPRPMNNYNRPQSTSPSRQNYNRDNRDRRSQSPYNSSYDNRSQNRPRSYDNNRQNSPYRQDSKNTYIRDMQAYTPSGTERDRIERTRSQSPIPVMPGTNCHPEYKIGLNNDCTKCGLKNSHAEHLCRKYFYWSSRICRKCNKGNHPENRCKDDNQRRSATPDRNGESNQKN